jgi:putative transposase
MRAGPSGAAAASIMASAEYGTVSINHTERLAEAGIEPSLGSVGDGYGNALAATINGLYKAAASHRCGPRRGVAAVAFATLERVARFNNRRRLAPIGNIPPAAAEATCYAQLAMTRIAASDANKTAPGNPGAVHAR